ncbi:MAG: DUF6220 domain-containing protein [Anaerolineales bacterium]|nr:DUF6220 domain-containing protein [Anaerolineales bacterium]
MKAKLTTLGKYLYLAFSWLFVAGVVYQVYLTGLAVVAQKRGWGPHVETGHALGIPILLMILSMYLGRLPRDVKIFTWLLLFVYILQADVLIFMRRSFPYLAAVHPVLALVDFGLGSWLAVQAWREVRRSREAGLDHPQVGNKVFVQGE